MQKDGDVGDRETTINDREVNSVVEGRKIGNRSIADREMYVEGEGMTIGGLIRDKIMVGKDVKEEPINVKMVINNELATGVVMRLGEMYDGDQHGVKLDDEKENLYRCNIKKNCKEIVNNVRSKMYHDWKIKTESLKSVNNVTLISNRINALNKSSDNIGEMDLGEPKYKKSALRLRLERMRGKNTHNFCNENIKLAEIKNKGDINENMVSSNDTKGDKNSVHSGDDNKKDTKSENEMFVDKNEVTTEIVKNNYQDIFCEVDETDIVQYLVQLRQGEIEKDLSDTERHDIEIKIDEFKKNPEIKDIERVLKENIHKKILKEGNGNSFSRADKDGKHHYHNIKKETDDVKQDFKVKNDNAINMRLEQLLNLKKDGSIQTSNPKIENSTNTIESENKTSVEGPKHPRLKKLLALKTKTEQCHSKKNLDIRLQKLLASKKKNIDKNNIETLDT